MSRKIISNNGCYSCAKLNKQSTNSIGSGKKLTTKVVIPRKILVSKKLLSTTSLDRKSYSTGVISNEKNISTIKSRKTTKSDVSFIKNIGNNSMDYCKKCGDSIDKQSLNNSEIDKYKLKQPSTTITINTITSKSVKKDNKPIKKTQNSVQQYYKNENFCLSTDSVNTTENFKRISSLGTIKEVPEIRTTDESLIRICSDAESDNECLDTANQNVIRSLKEFRDKNYFECHSARSRIRHKASVTSLDNHKCVYRFYLNERLFPVPLNTDYKNRIRCVECHLPMELRNDLDDDEINGTIQAKVRLGDEIKDLMLLLPAREPLIIKEKRKEDRVDYEEIYFGVIKLSYAGHSIFNSTAYNESLALRYQKGYKHFDIERARYKPMEGNDVVFI